MALDGAVLNPRAFALRFSADNDERLLVVNLGEPFLFAPAPEPLLAPPRGADWELMWRSNEKRYGEPDARCNWRPNHWNLPAMCALLFRLTGENL